MAEMTNDSTPEKTSGVVYTCPMHPEIRSDKPGSCPKCGMFLVPEGKQASQADDADCGCAGEEHKADDGCCGGSHHHGKAEGGCCGGHGKHAHGA
jgi:Cu+-exporting ATPase